MLNRSIDQIYFQIIPFNWAILEGISGQHFDTLAASDEHCMVLTPTVCWNLLKCNITKAFRRPFAETKDIHTIIQKVKDQQNQPILYLW